MKMKTMLAVAALLGLIHPLKSHADDLFQMYWRGTYYTTNSSGRIVAGHFTEQDFINRIAQDNGLDPSQLVFVYRPNKRDTVVAMQNGAFVADVIQLQYVYTDVNNPFDTVTVRQAQLADEAHGTAIGSWMGLETRSRDSQGKLATFSLSGTMQYSIPETNAVFSGWAWTGSRVVDTSGAR